MRPCLWDVRQVLPWSRSTLERGKDYRSGGFTLVEVLVALSLLAICLVVILQLFSGGLKSGKLSDDYTRGIFHAKEKMEEILLLDTVEEGVTEGEFGDDFRWKADIVRLEQREDEAARLPFDTFTIAVEVSWGAEGHEKHFKIDTLKVFEKIQFEE
ncbi:MAG: prepilin-type N-terminal cleavage/methylation domain-containing protein [Syntrophales bacterium]|nr:prepilin-type N-terminal cleavage/methylation domain-containing protein [Syntrophales bacterium]